MKTLARWMLGTSGASKQVPFHFVEAFHGQPFGPSHVQGDVRSQCRAQCRSYMITHKYRRAVDAYKMVSLYKMRGLRKG